MTVETETSRVSYTGSGTTGPFSVPFYFLEEGDLVVIKVTIATGEEETLVLTTDYTVTGEGDEDGGSVTLVTAISSSYRLVIYRDPAILQETRYPRNDPFPAATHEMAVDRLTMIAQRIRKLLSRALRQPDGDSADMSTLPAAVDRASKYLAFDADGDPIASESSAGGAAVSTFMETVLDDTTSNAALTTLTATRAEAGAVAVPVLSKLREVVSVLDFIPVAEHAAIAARTSTTDVAAYIQAAVDALPAYGGTLFFPPGRYTIGSVITMDEGIVLRGAGYQTSTIRPTHAGVALAFGSNPSAVKRGMGMHDLGVVMANKAATALYLKGIVGGAFQNIYIEGTAESGRSDKGVVIDGYNASSFFNTFQNVEINHIKTGFQLTKTGTTNGTDQVFVNCSVFGDVGTIGDASVGFQVDAEQGNGTTWIGGNIESCAKGMLGKTDANMVTVTGCRFEANTVDIEKEVTSYPWTIIGCSNITTFTDNGGAGYQSNIIGCTDASGFPIASRLFHSLSIVPQAIGNTPLSITAIAGQTASLMRLNNSSGNPILELGPEGQLNAGAGNIATNATSGFLGVTTCAGTPTGSPSLGNWAPLVIDRTNNKLYFYSNGSWRDAGP